MARQLELKTEHTVPRLGALLRQDSPLNPVRPLPPVGGNPALHGIEPDEQDVTLALGERVGHTIVYGTTRVGKTRWQSCWSHRISVGERSPLSLTPKGMLTCCCVYGQKPPCRQGR